jgi:hypothetical protein
VSAGPDTPDWTAKARNWPVERGTHRDLRLRGDLRDLSPQSLGDWWIEASTSAVLEVASVIVPHEHNYLLNPAHPDFAKIRTDPAALFHFDPRLFR